MAADSVNKVEAALRSALASLTALGVRPVLVGGLAVSTRTEPRFTRDVDLAVAIERDRDAERLVNELVGRGFRIVALEQEEARRLATTRLSGPSGDASGVVIDLLFASCGIEPEIVGRAEPLEVFSGLVVPVASVCDLIAMKVLSRDDKRRPQDAGDLRALLKVASKEQIDAARAALELIAARGFHRDRDLRQQLDAALRDFARS